MAMMEGFDSPFPGLRYFSADESHLFFGREGQSDELAQKMDRARFVAVVGTSGSGKSSLVRAGLLPSLEEGCLVKLGSHWRLVDMRPGSHPIASLSASLRAAGLSGTLADVESLSSNSLSLFHHLRQAYEERRLEANENLLILVDQFEELFRYESSAEALDERDEKAAFVKLLLEVSKQPDVPVYVVITMRSDFLGDCARFRDLPEAINAGQYLIPRMTREQRRRAIEGPIHMGSGEITQRLLQRILNDVGENPDQLPVMQHALMRTWYQWRQRTDAARPMDLEDYEAIGTLENALSKHADEAYAEARSKLPVTGANVVRRIFQRLRERDSSRREIRRPTSLGELCAVTVAPDDDVLTALECFRREGRSFLVPPVSVVLTMESALDITHECLLRQWKRLQGPVGEDSGWLAEEEESRTTLLRLVDRATEQQAFEEPQYLRGPLLQLALEWWKKQNPTEAWAARYTPSLKAAKDLLDASEANREREVQERADSARREQVALEERIRGEEERARREQLAIEENRRIEAELRIKQQKSQWLRAVAIGSIIALALTLGIAMVALQQRQKAIQSSEEAGRSAALARQQRDYAVQFLARANDNGKRLQDTLRTLVLDEDKLKDETALAEASAHEAAQEKQAAIAAKTSAQALNRLGDQPDLAFLLAVQASRERETIETQNGLLTVVEAVPNLRTMIRGFDGVVSGIAFRGNTLSSLELSGALFTHTDQGVLTGKSQIESSFSTLTANGDYVVSRYLAPVKVFSAANGVGVTNLLKLKEPIAFSGDGKVAAGLAEDGHSIEFWDLLHGGEMRPALPLDNGPPPRGISLSQDGTSLAIARSDSEITLFDVHGKDKPLQKLELKSAGVCPPNFDFFVNLAFDRNTTRLVEGCASSPVISLWDISLKAPTTHSYTQNGGTTSLVFSPDCKFLASGSATGFVTLWGIGNGTMLQLWSQRADFSKVGSLSFSADSKTLASAGVGVALWSVDQQNLARVSPAVDKAAPSVQPPQYYSDRSEKISFNRRGQVVTTSAIKGSQNQVSVRTRSLGNLNDQKNEILDSTNKWQQVAISPDGQTVAEIISPGKTPSDNSKLPLESSLPDKGRKSCSQSSIQLFNSSGKGLPDKPFAGDDGRSAISISFSPDSRELLLATCQNPGTDARQTLPRVEIARWDLKTHAVVGSVIPVDDGASALALSPDGRQLAASIGNSPTKVVLWNLDTNRRQNLGESAGNFTMLRFSPDSRELVSADNYGNVTVWNAESGKPGAHSKTHASVVDMSFSGDGRLLAVSSGDGSIVLYETQELRQIGTLPRSGSLGSTAVAFNPEDNTMLASDVSGTVTLWDINPETWKSVACRMANRNLTYDEWQRYGDGPVYQRTCDVFKEVDPSLLQAARALLRQGDSRKSLAILQQIKYLEQTKQFDPQRELTKLENANSAEDAVQHARSILEADPVAALGEVQKALRLDPSVRIPADSWIDICQDGMVMNAAAKVITACNKAVELAPNQGESLGLRGIARALTNDFSGAAQDLQGALDAPDAESMDNDTKVMIRDWIRALNTGKNPITPEVLKKLLSL